MNRWILLAPLLLAGLAAQAQVDTPAAPASSIAAQTLGQDGVIRTAPADVKPARMVVTAPPQITLNGQADRLSPGSRIRGTNNLLVLSGSVVGQTLPVVYRRDAAGLVHEVWLLTEEEYAKVGGADDGSAEGPRRLAELLNLVFGARR